MLFTTLLAATLSLGEWPVLKTYEGPYLDRVKMPLGGIGTGTISLAGNGALVDWELQGAPNKGCFPRFWGWAPHFAIRTEDAAGRRMARVLEGPIPLAACEGSQGVTAANANFPRMDAVTFKAAYPLATLAFEDAELPLEVALEAMNPLVPGDADASGIPATLFRWTVRNRSADELSVSLAVTLVDVKDVELAVALPPDAGRVTQAREIREPGWNVSLERYWNRFLTQGDVSDQGAGERRAVPARQTCVAFSLKPGEVRAIPFVLGWRTETRSAWDVRTEGTGTNRVTNCYATHYASARQAAEDLLVRLPELEAKTVAFVRSVLARPAPDVVREAALFNLSTFRTETCFRLADGNLYGWEGCSDRAGSAPGNCTHVWGYEHALVDLWPDLARRMLDLNFGVGQDDRGFIMCRVGLPLASEGLAYDCAAADGQMQCIVKACEYWRKTRDDAWLRKTWPRIRRAVEASWVPKGWDADRDGVMEGCQHNTMDVEYFGPNPQMQFLYLAALKAAAAMGEAADDRPFAVRCRELLGRGSVWTERHLFNGSYYEQKVRPVAHLDDVEPVLILPKHRPRFKADPDYQLGAGCLIDQLLGDYAAQAAGLGPVADPAHAASALGAVLRHNRKPAGEKSFNPMRSFVLPDEASYVMAWYPEGRKPKTAFPYYRETMTGFEYVLATLLARQGDTATAEAIVRDVRRRYDGRRRNPFDEAECGHHYVRALAAWSVLEAFWEK